MKQLSNFEIIALSDCLVRDSKNFTEVFDPIKEISFYVGIPGYIMSTITGFIMIY